MPRRECGRAGRNSSTADPPALRLVASWRCSLCGRSAQWCTSASLVVRKHAADTAAVDGRRIKRDHLVYPGTSTRERHSLMALALNISCILRRFGCAISICLLMLAVLTQQEVVSAAHANIGPAVVMMTAAQTQYGCHATPACAAFVAPAETSLNDHKQLQSLRFFNTDTTRLIQSGPSSDTPPPRV